MVFQERQEFFLEGNLLMMVLLIGNVLLDTIDSGFAYAEGAVSCLPSEVGARDLPFFVDPFRGIRFNNAHDIGNAVSRRQLAK